MRGGGGQTDEKLKCAILEGSYGGVGAMEAACLQKKKATETAEPTDLDPFLNAIRRHRQQLVGGGNLRRFSSQSDRTPALSIGR